MPEGIPCLSRPLPSRSIKPRILCLHGRGSSGAIFEVQTIRLRKALKEHFDFVFVNGPFECAAGPGVLPFFDGCGPFYEWTQGLLPEETGGCDALEDASQGALDVLTKVAETASPPGQRRGPWVGVMGFSQGARVAAGMLKEQSYRCSRLLPHTLPLSFRFGIFFHAANPPLRFGTAEEMDALVGYAQHLVEIPTVQIHGLLDGWLHPQQSLAAQFANEGKVCIGLQLGHSLPVAPKDVEKVAVEVIDMWSRIRAEVRELGRSEITYLDLSGR